MADGTIWHDDVRGFMSQPNWTKIWVSPQDDAVTRLNAVMRFSLYYGVTMALVRGRSWPLVVPVATAVVTHLLYRYVSCGEGRTSSGGAQEPNANESPTLPTAHNPMMNFMVSDMARDPDRPPAANVLDAGVKHEMTRAYEAGIPDDVKDVYGRNTGTRAWYTMPCTQAVNEQTAFAKWLFRPVDGVSFKERAVLSHA